MTAQPLTREQLSRAPSVTDAERARTLWASCRRLGDDAEAVARLRGRGLDPVTVEDRDLARALPFELPRWASSWRALGARAVLPVFGQDAELVSLRVSVDVGAGSGAAVLADGSARALLRGDSWLMESGCRAVYLTEGDVGFLIRATAAGETESAPPVFGILGANAWPEWLAACIPAGFAVCVDVRRDEAGERMLRRVAQELGEKCPIYRTPGGAP